MPKSRRRLKKAGVPHHGRHGLPTMLLDRGPCLAHFAWGVMGECGGWGARLLGAFFDPGKAAELARSFLLCLVGTLRMTHS